MPLGTRGSPRWPDELAARVGDLLTVPTALESPAAKRAAAAATDAVAVDMESAAIAAVAARARVPFVALRVVVDGLDDALPAGAERWIDERGSGACRPALRAAVEPAAMARAADVGEALSRRERRARSARARVGGAARARRRRAALPAGS